MSESSMYMLDDYIIIFSHNYEYEVYQDEISRGLILKNDQIEIEIIHQFDIEYYLYITDNTQPSKRYKLDSESIKLLPTDIKVQKA